MSHVAAPQTSEDASRLDQVNLALAGLLFLSPWLLGYAGLTIASITAWISAMVIALAATFATIHFREWEEWVCLLGGIWLLAAPWLLHFVYFGGALAGFTGIGVFIVAISATEIWCAHHPGRRPTDRRS